MIKKITLKNFESWEEGEFEFSQGVNIIYGVSDKGKSAVFNGAEWVRTNRPLGTELYSDWGGDTEVGIEFYNGLKVVRGNDKKGNFYRLSSLEESLRAFNKEVPQEVIDMINMPDLNVQPQKSPHFLLDDTPPEVSRKLNQIASLSNIDLSFRNINSKIKTINSDIKNNTAAIKTEKKSLEEFVWLDVAEDKLKMLELKSALFSKIKQLVKQLRNTQKRIDILLSQIFQYTQIVKAKRSIDKLHVKIKQIKKIDKHTDYLTTQEERWKSANTIIEKNKALLITKPQLNKLKKLIKSIEFTNSKQEILLTKHEQLIEANLNLEKATKEEKQARLEWDKALPDICPLCKQEWKRK